MPISRRRFAAQGALALCSAAVPGLGVAAPDYPNRLIKLILPFAAGGSGALIARLLADNLAEGLGGSVIVDYKPGAAAIIGTDFVAKAPADGYTLLMSATGVIQNATIYRKLPYDPFKDLQPVSLVGTAALALVVGTALGVGSLKELAAKAHSSPLSYASFGIGTTQHLYGSLLASQFGADMAHVAYKGEAPLMPDLLRGEVASCFLTIPTAVQFSKDNRLKVLAVTGAKRTQLLPGVPTLREQGMAGFEAVGWYAIFFPAGVPPDIVSRVSAEIARIVAIPAVASRLTESGLEPAASTPQELAVRMRTEFAIWDGLVKANKIQPQ